MKGKTSGARWFVNHASTNRVMFVCPAFVFWISLDDFGALSEIGLQDLRTGLCYLVQRPNQLAFVGTLVVQVCAHRRTAALDGDLLSDLLFRFSPNDASTMVDLLREAVGHSAEPMPAHAVDFWHAALNTILDVGIAGAGMITADSRPLRFASVTKTRAALRLLATFKADVVHVKRFAAGVGNMVVLSAQLAGIFRVQFPGWKEGERADAAYTFLGSLTGNAVLLSLREAFGSDRVEEITYPED